ncbi:alpha/beta hydrolase [Streptacidiphilus sp. PAMC 29251]
MAAISALPTPAAADTVGTVTCPSVALGTVPALGLDILSATCGPATTSAGTAPGWALMTVTMTSTAVFTGDTSLAGAAANPQKLSANILLPPGYTPTRAAGYDSLYLLHGGGGTYQDWVRQSATAVDLPGATSVPSSSTKTGMLDVIGRSANPYQGVIVMPEAGISGLYTDWKGTTDGGFAPKWETYHLNELLPWIDAHFDTVSNRSARAVAGFSLGGFGALKYAADRPDLFGAVGAFSPGTDLTSTVTPTPGNTQAPAGRRRPAPRSASSTTRCGSREPPSGRSFPPTTRSR